MRRQQSSGFASVQLLVVIAQISIVSALLLSSLVQMERDATVAVQFDSIASTTQALQRESRGFYDEWDFHHFMIVNDPTPGQVDSVATVLGDYRARIVQADEGLVQTLPFLAQTKQKEAKQAAIHLHVDAVQFIEEGNRLEDELVHLSSILQSMSPEP